MNTSKRAVRLIAEVCRRKGIRKVVFSPGSRSAPLVIAFSQIKEVECVVIPDERVAGYFALGMAQQLREVVAVVCTSGSAVANLYPAVLEAHYQKVPLLILSADRPDGEVQNGGNQAIYQEDIFSRHAPCRTVNGDAETDAELKQIAEDTASTIDECMYQEGGAAHLNVRMSEPLYETTNIQTEKINIPEIKGREAFEISTADITRVEKTFASNQKKMVIVGSKNADAEFLNLLTKLNTRQDLIILHENLSNLQIENAVWNIDAAMASLIKEASQSFIPDIVITFGNQIVSRRIKQFLFGKPTVHWDVPAMHKLGGNRKMFGDMLEVIAPVNEKQFLEILLAVPDNKTSSYKKDWLALSAQAEEKTNSYLAEATTSDLNLFETLVKSFPANANIQYGNSTPIRYSNFFKHKQSLTINANRGTSGIDGCVSTAAGAAYVNDRMTVCVVGDISFFYDSNAIWNKNLSPDFRIIVINNGGGNIFRLIDGPTKVDDFEKFFETNHDLTARHVASLFRLPYYICAHLKGNPKAQKELDETLKVFYQPQQEGKAAILEIITDGIESAEVYRKYFEYLGASPQNKT